MELWHRRFGHISPILVHTCKENGVWGFADLMDNDFHCEVCKLNKFRKPHFKLIGSIHSKHRLELLFGDVWGPCRTVGRNRERYFLSIMDDHF